MEKYYTLLGIIAGSDKDKNCPHAIHFDDKKSTLTFFIDKGLVASLVIEYLNELVSNISFIEQEHLNRGMRYKIVCKDSKLYDRVVNDLSIGCSDTHSDFKHKIWKLNVDVFDVVNIVGDKKCLINTFSNFAAFVRGLFIVAGWFGFCQDVSSRPTQDSGNQFGITLNSYPGYQSLFTIFKSCGFTINEMQPESNKFFLIIDDLRDMLFFDFYIGFISEEHKEKAEFIIETVEKVQLKNFMNISEIFFSICGEGIEVGKPAVFIRSFGCNMRCKYCDSVYSFDKDEMNERSLLDISNQVKSYPAKVIFITGGEPLLWGRHFKVLLSVLSYRYEIIIQSNGSLVNYDVLKYCDQISMDLKGPSAGIKAQTRCDVNIITMIFNNMFEKKKMLKEYQVKFLVEGHEDLTFVLDKLKVFQSELDSCVLDRVSFIIGPVGGLDVDGLWKMIQERKEVRDLLFSPKVRVGFQVHKMIWPDKIKGV